MIEKALQRVYGQVEPHIARRSRDRLRFDVAVICAALATSFLILPWVYAWALPGITVSRALAGEAGDHIWLNCAANAVSMLSVIRLSGRFDRKLAAVFTRALLVHGLLGFGILLTREYHSNQVMLMSAYVSMGLGALVVMAKHRALRARIALIGPIDPLFDKVREPREWISDPATDLSDYDLLLTSNVSGLDARWAQALSGAMLMGKPVRFLAEFIEEDRGLVSIEHFDFEHLPAAGLTSYRVRKRLMDIGLVLVSAPIAILLLGLGALLVWATSGRPVLFVQSRVGLGGKPFRMYKLRTMLDAAAADGRATSDRADARITPAGRMLRRFRIDELPQLWNVLIGDMSLIGPRPEWTILSEAYTRELPVYAYRHLVRPGITGWAQVRGGYASNLEETRQKVGYDLFYIKNMSFSLDVQILARTIWTLLTGSGAR